MNTAARSIAEGRFDVRVPEARRDEPGELGSSVNAMAAQLGDLVERQRRLTADVAHELCSPIARMQRALGTVEQRAVPTAPTGLKIIIRLPQKSDLPNGECVQQRQQSSQRL